MKIHKLYVLKIVRDNFEDCPRIPHTKLHSIIRKKTGVKMRKTTQGYIDEGYNLGVIKPPRPILKFHTKTHQHVLFVDGSFDELDNIVENMNDVRYACALSGPSEKILITSFTEPGEDLILLKYTRADGFSTDESKCLKKMKFLSDELPIPIDAPRLKLNWDKKDWQIFHNLFPNMRIPYLTLSEKIDLEWRAIKKRMQEKIIPACDVATYFFPKGQANYQQLFLEFRSEYQKNFFDKMNLMPSTSYFLHFGKDKIGIFVFPQNINEVLKLFKKMEKEGIINDFRYFIPLNWHHCDLGWPWTGSASST
jgi:hypothetical protein